MSLLSRIYLPVKKYLNVTRDIYYNNFGTNDGFGEKKKST